MRYLLLLLFSVHFLSACSQDDSGIITGADQMDRYLPLLRGKNIAVVANHTSVVNGTHLVDTLSGLGKENVRIMKILSPEHGFRGDYDAGEFIADEVDPVTGIPLVSLYGNHKKPLPEDMDGIEMVIFDIQDVGVRFYTYISTLHYVMEFCAENGVPLLLLDRPNPNGGYVDGPVLKPEYQSFVGMHPIPVVYGLTIGELAMMINGEGWLRDQLRCDLEVIPCENYFHGKPFSLPVNPSPNLTGHHAIMIYPSTCFFEGTVINEGRGTKTPFEVFGHPLLPGDYSYTPRSIPGMSKNPKLMDQLCTGTDLREFEPEDGWTRLYLNWLIESYNNFPEKDIFFIPFFEKLSGTDQLRIQIQAGWNEEAIRESWKNDLENYRIKRNRYLLYP